MKSVTIEAKTFAEMLGITEGELILPLRKLGRFKKRPFQNPIELALLSYIPRTP
ncbi:hypothetical protein [Klebsiella pneumoniae]|uniref:hypothetical protein n=1 Tax=Klebsiella pneumoniae TaxID=573 RepID=UPI00177C680A|nr:hypothetical protein [Klebsiella pneumoniae]